MYVQLQKNPLAKRQQKLQVHNKVTASFRVRRATILSSAINNSVQHSTIQWEF